MLLIQGKKKDVEYLEAEKFFITLSEYEKKKTIYRKAIPAILIGIGVVLAAALNIVNILISAMIGALLMILTGVLKPEEAYKSVEWKVIFMMAGVLSMGAALEKTGGAEMIAHSIQSSLGQYNAYVTLSAIFLVSFFSTYFISSNATAPLMATVVVNFASSLSVDDDTVL